MGQIVGLSAKCKRANLNALGSVPTPANGEFILISSNNSMTSDGQGNFDCYIVGDGQKAATALSLHKFKAEELEEYLKESDGVDVSYDATNCTTGMILKTSGSAGSFDGYQTSGFIQIPNGTNYIYTSDLLKNEGGVYIGLKFYTSDSNASAISDNVADKNVNIPTTINMEDWPTAKFVRFCGTTSKSPTIRFFTEAGVSQLSKKLISSSLGESKNVAISQKTFSDKISEIEDVLRSLGDGGINEIYNSSNSELVSGALRVSGTIYSSSSFRTSKIIDIPKNTQYLETYGLYKNDSGLYIGLLLYDESSNILPLVAASGEDIPKVINLADYPTATQLRWCTHGNAEAYVRCYSHSIIEEGVHKLTSDELGQNNDLLISQKGITDALSKMYDDIKGAQYIELQNDTLKEATNKWTFGSTWTYSTEGATPPAIGAENYMRNTSIYYSDRRYMRVTALMGTDTKLMVVCGYGNSLNDGEGASAFGVDFGNKKLIIYGVDSIWSGSGDEIATSIGYDLTKELEVTAIPDSAIGARKYIIELRKYGTISQLTLMDTKTGEHISVSHDGWACGRQNQLYGFYCESGTLPTLSDFGVYSENNPDIVFAGDSITEGVYVTDRKYTYPNRYRSELPSKKVVVSARGGQTIGGLMSLFESEWNIVRPKAISLLIGANGGNSASYFTQFKNACDAIDAKLYVHYCSCRTGRDLSQTNDTLVPALNLESAHFDWATAIDNTPNSDYSNINTSLFADSAHPTIAGQAELYKRLRIDCPSMYL